MKRRNVLIGLGTAAAGSSVAFGSGAFTQLEAERKLSIGVTGDSSSQVELQANTNLQNDSISDDPLSVDLSSINQDSTVIIGDVADSPTNVGGGTSFTQSAFTVTNNTDSDGNAAELDIEFQPSDGDAPVTVYYSKPEGTTDEIDGKVTPGTTDGPDVTGLADSESIDVFLKIDLTGISGGSTKDETLTIIAERTNADQSSP